MMDGSRGCRTLESGCLSGGCTEEGWTSVRVCRASFFPFFIFTAGNKIKSLCNVTTPRAGRDVRLEVYGAPAWRALERLWTPTWIDKFQFEFGMSNRNHSSLRDILLTGFVQRWEYRDEVFRACHITRPFKWKHGESILGLGQVLFSLKYVNFGHQTH